MTCLWISGFLALRISGFLVPWLRFALAGSLLTHNDTPYSFGISFTVFVSVFLQKRWFSTHKFFTLLTPYPLRLNKSDCNLDTAPLLTRYSSTLLVHTASLCVIQKYSSDASKIARALLWNLTAEIWFAQSKAVFFTKKFSISEFTPYNLKTFLLNLNCQFFLCKSIIVFPCINTNS